MNQTIVLNHRSFISRTAGCAAATGLFLGQTMRARAQNSAGQSPKFKLCYALHRGHVQGQLG
jgi:hypothetical protein